MTADNMGENIFITGGAGFLGSYIVKEFLKNQGNNLFLLVRDKDGVSADKRTDKVFKALCGKEFKKFRKRIHVIKGDITYKDLGIKAEDRKKLIKDIDIIYHSAALCNFIQPLKIMRAINVQGTKNVFDFALECSRKGRLKQVNHISTVAVAGNSKGYFYEHMLDKGQKFNNPYEQSKFEAEKLVEKYRKKALDISVFRPSLIVGDSKTGQTSNFDIFYRFLEILSLEIFDRLPVSGKSYFNLVPVDSVARSIYLISKKKKEKNSAYHIINSKDSRLGFLVNTASIYFGFKKPILTSLKKNSLRLTNFQRKLLDTYLPYGNYKARFDGTNTNKLIGNNGFSWPEPNRKNLEILFRYCDKVNYIQKK